jgi:WD40 repeat protein
VWSIEGVSRVCVLPGHGEPALAVALRPDGKGIATSGRDKTIKFWTLGK